MKRNALRFFFLAVQFVMLAVSIPKVATLFHAYDTHTLWPLLGGVDVVSWGIGIALDLTSTVTTWAGLQKYEATGKRLSLIPAGIIVAVCSGLSVIANYEDAATIQPAQYQDITVFTHPALLFNPLLISAPPILVLLLILLVPSVLARPRQKTAEEIAADTAHQLASINAKHQIRNAQLGAWKDTFSAVTERSEDAPESLPMRAPTAERGAPERQPKRMSKKQWDALPLKERVLESRTISAKEAAQVLGITDAHARKLFKDVRAPDDEPSAPAGRTGAHFQSLIDALYARRTPEASTQAHKLERALGIKKTRVLHPVTSAGDHPTVPLISEDEAFGTDAG